jgi:hypothetical protein
LAIRNPNDANQTGWGAISIGDAKGQALCPYPLESNSETLMKLLTALTILAVVAAGPAFAEGKCATGPKSKWQPKSALESQLQADGYKVRQIKVEGGCYEVYATDKDGKRANMAFNAETLEKLANAEAGEN